MMYFDCPFICFVPQQQFQGVLMHTLPLQAWQFYNTDKKTEECVTDFLNNRQDQFLKCFEKELRKTSIKYSKKVWTETQDQYLLQLRKKNYKWTQISKQILDSNPQICKRRYIRLKQDEVKWPKSVEEEIRRVCSRNDLGWEQKMRILYSKFPKIRGYSKKMIKQRYLTYLQQGIEQKPWTIEQDMTLIKMLKNGIRRWKTIAQQIPGRTKLHLKNRYYGCLRAISKKIQNQLNQVS